MVAMNEDALLALRDESGQVPTSAVGEFLAVTDHSLLGQVADMVLHTWRRWHPTAPELKVGRRYRIAPAGPFPATLAVIVPDDPDRPTGVGFYALWQVRTPLGRVSWLLLDDAWVGADTVRPVDR
jgi:hypothetical protein